jgi:hypothetical protein
VLSHFLNDVITVKRHGKKEIYAFYGIKKFSPAGNVLGEGLDLLNWHKGEKREGTEKTGARVKTLNFKNPNEARFIVLDAYLRYPKQFLASLRTKLTGLKKKRSGREIFEESIEEVSGVPFKLYLEKATEAQLELINSQRPD